MKFAIPLSRVALWAFVLGTLFFSFSPLPAAAVTTTELFNYWDDRYVTAVDELIPFPPPPSRPLDRTLNTEVLAKAQPDECFYDIGDSNNAFSLFAPPDPNICYASNGAGDGQSGQINPGVLKVNQAYVWGLAKAGDDLWFGTGPNTHCLVLGTYLQESDPTISDNYVCEFGESETAGALIAQGLDPDTAASIGDWRPPQIFVYDTLNGTLTDKTGLVYASPPADQQRLGASLGIRSAGALDDIVILGGPGIAPGGGLLVNMFAFNAQTGDFIASTSLTDYSNIRKWLVIDGVLYTAVGGGSGGAVLRWVGTAADPFSGGTNGFEVVGNIDATGAELALHDGRLFVSTWAGEELAGQGEAGIWMSPVIPLGPDGGLKTTDADQWTKVWTISDYEPDPVTARTYGGGALASFGGYLYWGTMNVPLLPTVAHFSYYNYLLVDGNYPETEEVQTKAFLANHRPISIFRGRNFDTPEENIELLYGLNEMYAFVPPYPPPAPAAAPAVGGQAVGPPPGWNLVDNNMGGVEPLYGQAGFDNFYNNYTWTMAVFNGKLYVGSMDVSILISDFVGASPQFEQVAPRADLGADLMRFDSTTGPATGESYSGAGNDSSYGIRTMIADDALYLGMANPMNLRTDPADAQGGWELIKAVEAPDTVSGDSGGGGGCFISAAGLKGRVPASPIFAILAFLGVIGLICALGMAIQRKKTVV
jgi:hypothetical protein